MSQGLDVTQWQEQLVDACASGDEARAGALVAQPGSRKARALLEAMLAHPNALVRQAAVWELGALGGASSARRLEQQLAIEEARGDYDGSSVADAISQALGRIEDADARTTLMRRLQRLASGKPDPGDVGTVVHALWRRRHPELLPAIRKTLELLTPPAPRSLLGLLTLLEKSPEEPRSWLGDMSMRMSFHGLEDQAASRPGETEGWI